MAMTMPGPALWTGLVMIAGALGAMTARKVKLPAACGALAGGMLLACLAGALGILRPDHGFTKSLLVAFLCFVVGAEIELTPLVRTGRRVIGAAALQIAAVTTGVLLAGALIGFTWYAALMVGLAFSASSPTVFIAVAAEAGARGPFTQRILVMSSLTLLVASLLVYALGAPRQFLTVDLLLILIAGVIGLVMLVPLSRIETRGAMTTCVAFGVFLLALLGPGYPTPSLAITAYLCGLLAAGVLPNRQILRDTLRALTLPAVVLLFAVSAAFTEPLGVLLGLVTGLILLAGRASGLYLAGTLTSGRAEGVHLAAAQIPIAGLSCAGPVLLVLTWLVGNQEIPADSIFGALLLSEVAGLIATRWALRRAGEAPLLTGDPDSWRAAMS